MGSGKQSPSADTETHGAADEEALDPRARQVVARRVGRPLGLALFVVGAGLGLAGAVAFCDPVLTPAWVLLATFGLAMSAEAS